MSVDPEALRVPIDGFDMHLRPSELAAVAEGLGMFGASSIDQHTLVTLAEAVRSLPPTDRAPLWELATRHFARRMPIDQAAGSIGMDAIRARSLIQTFTAAL